MYVCVCVCVDVDVNVLWLKQGFCKINCRICTLSLKWCLIISDDT